MTGKEKLKHQLINNYYGFCQMRANENSLTFYYSQYYKILCIDYLNGFKGLQDVFINDVKKTRVFYFLYADCILTYIEFYLRDAGFIDKTGVYLLPDKYENRIENICKLVNDGLEIFDKFQNAAGDLNFSEDENKRIKRLLLQKATCVLSLCFDKYEEEFLYYANQTVEIGSIQGHTSLIIYYCSDQHLNLDKAKALLENCLSLPINGEYAINNNSQICGKLVALSVLYHTYIAKEDYNNALIIAHKDYKYLSSEEAKILDEEFRNQLLEITTSFIVQSSGRLIRDKNQEYDVFISYSSHDSQLIDQIEQSLKENNIKKIWRDNRAIEGGDSFPIEIANGIKNCNIFLIVLTPESEQSPWVYRELHTAIRNNKLIIPYKVGRYQSLQQFEFMLGVVQIIQNDKKNIDELSLFIKEKLNNL